tara:strand:- start:4503 stop:5777 length:1275 start_codon:yes stop_codon:yes gene_type:complete
MIAFINRIIPLPYKVRLKSIAIEFIFKNLLTKKYVVAFLIKNIARVECKPVIWVDCSKDSYVKEIRKCASGQIFGPKDISGRQSELTVKVPSVELHRFLEVVISAKSSHLIASDCVYMERLATLRTSNVNYSTGFVLDHNEGHALVNKKQRSCIDVIDSGVFFGGNGSWNYYHWIIEILPKIEFFIENNGFLGVNKIILPACVKNIKSFWESFLIFYSGSLEDLVFIEPDKAYKINTLLHFTAPSNALFNTRNPESKKDFFYYNFDSLGYVRKVVLDYYQDENSISELVLPQKIFLARKAGSARDYNQKQVSMALSDCGITSIFIEDYTFKEQVRIFENAKLIVGPSGAAWTNLIFCKAEATKAISWLPEHIGEFSAFSTLAKWAGVDMEFLIAEPDNVSEFHGNYKIDVTSLVKRIKLSDARL